MPKYQLHSKDDFTDLNTVTCTLSFFIYTLKSTVTNCTMEVASLSITYQGFATC